MTEHAEATMSAFGFCWGPARVERAAVHERAGGTWRVLRVATDRQCLDIYISPQGHRLRVFRDGTELT